MTVETEQVKVWMEAAAANLDFDEARKLRDRIALIRGGADTLISGACGHYWPRAATSMPRRSSKTHSQPSSVLIAAPKSRRPFL